MIEINEMSIRIPGNDAAEGKRIGGMVAQLVAEKLPPDTSERSIGNLDIKVQVSAGMSPDEVARKIAGQIIFQLRQL